MMEHELPPLGAKTIILSANTHVKHFILTVTLCGSDYYLHFPDEDIEVRKVIKSAKNFSMGMGAGV